jgi:Leucine-rich repeat (LRR) protein
MIALSDLQILDLSQNFIEGTGLPRAKISYTDDEADQASNQQSRLLWPDLRSLNLYSNKFTGPLFLEEYAHWTQLRTLRLGFNTFQSSLPQGNAPWSQWSQLELLELQANNLSGDLASNIGLLSQLTCLDLRRNSFVRTLPANWVQSNDLPFVNDDQALENAASSLWYLGISDNSLTGPIPTLMSSSLARFDASENRFSGPIPIPPLAEWMNGINNPDERPLPLEWLLLDSNFLMSGTIPFVDMAYLRLKNVGLSQNAFTGTIGEEIGDIQVDFASFYAEGNLLEGSIPTTIGRLTNMQIFVLGQNLLTGPLPSEVGTMQDLRYLFLEQNSLSGTIPLELSSLGNLGT